MLKPIKPTQREAAYEALSRLEAMAEIFVEGLREGQEDRFIIKRMREILEESGFGEYVAANQVRVAIQVANAKYAKPERQDADLFGFAW